MAESGKVVTRISCSPNAFRAHDLVLLGKRASFMCSSGDWRETSNGNHVLIDGDLAATVYEKDGQWSGIWNGAADGEPRLLKAKCETAEETMELMDLAIADGEGSTLFWPPAGSWR